MSEQFSADESIVIDVPEPDLPRSGIPGDGLETIEYPALAIDDSPKLAIDASPKKSFKAASMHGARPYAARRHREGIFPDEEDGESGIRPLNFG